MNDALGTMTAQQAKAIRDSVNNRVAMKKLLNILALGVAGGGVARAGFGWLGNIQRNLRRATHRDERDQDSPMGFEVPVKAGSSVDPDWYIPAAIIGATGSGIAGWSLLDRWLQAHKRSRRAEEVAKAKQEFHGALAQSLGPRPKEERTIGTAAKYSSLREELDKLAEAYVSGELDETLKDAGDTKFAGNALWGAVSPLVTNPAYLTLATLIALGTGATTYKMMDRTDPEKKKIELYREAMRRRRLSRIKPLEGTVKPVIAKPETQRAAMNETEDPQAIAQSKSGLDKSAFGGAAAKWGLNFGRKMLPSVVGTTGVLGAGALASRPGGIVDRKFIRPKVQSYMKNPEFQQWMINQAIGTKTPQGFQWSPLMSTFRHQYPILGFLASLGLLGNRAPVQTMQRTNAVA